MTTTAHLAEDGARPSDTAIRSVFVSGRAFTDDDDDDAPIYGVTAEDHELDAAYALARACGVVSAPSRVVDGPELGVGFRKDGSRIDGAECCRRDEFELRAGFEEGRDHNLDHVGIDVLHSPTCRSRGGTASRYMCWQCGQRQGYEFQSPSDVFETAWRCVDDCAGQSAVRAVKQMATLLREGQFESVASRCCVCSNVDCVLRASLMTPEWRMKWLDGNRRPQEERDNTRKNQVVLVERNVRLLHNLVKGGVLDLVDVQHLLRFVASSSQFVHEREKKFIAVAMAAAEHPHLLGFDFADRQRFVDRMAAFANGYVVHVLAAHCATLSFRDSAWEAHLQKLVDTALPKAHDAVFALMVEANAESNGFQREPLQPGETVWAPVVGRAGRLVHQSSLDVFSPRVFFQRLSLCVTASPSFGLSFEGCGRYDGSNPFQALVTSNQGKQRGYETQMAAQAVSGGPQHTTAHGTVDLPASSDLQMETNVHPRLRYKNLFLALGYSDDEAEERIALMLDYELELGKETLRSGRGARPCYVLRRPKPMIRDAPRVGTVLGVRKRLTDTAEMVPLGRRWTRRGSLRA